MMKKIYSLLLMICLVFSMVLTPAAVSATETTTETSETQELTETQKEMKKNYERTVESNQIKGWPDGPTVYAKAAIVMDVDTGAILYAKNIDKALYPASITKIMTTILAIENSSLDDQVTFSDNAINSLPWDCSRIGARVGETFSMEDCLYAMMLSSANEVCIGVAEHVAGSEKDFVKMMNEKAKELGCTHTHFDNCNGMPDEDHTISAHDMALIAAYAYKNETFQKVTGSTKHVIGTTNKCGEKRYCFQHHKMMDVDGEFYYKYVVGGKTGFTQAAWNTLVTYAKKGGRTLVCVSMKTNGSQYYKDTKSLLKYGFNNFSNKTVSNDLSVDNLLYPSQFLGMTVDDQSSTVTGKVTVPDEKSLDDLTKSVTLDGQQLSFTYKYKDVTCGNFTIPVNQTFINMLDANSVSTLTATETSSLLKSSHAKSTVEKETTTGSSSQTSEGGLSSLQRMVSIPFINRMRNHLAVWQIGLFGILIVAVILYIVILIRTIVRSIKQAKRRKKKAKRRKEREKRAREAAAREAEEKNRDASSK